MNFTEKQIDNLTLHEDLTVAQILEKQAFIASFVESMIKDDSPLQFPAEELVKAADPEKRIEILENLFAKYLKVSKELGPTLKEAEAKKNIIPPEVIIKSLVKETEEMKAVIQSMMLLFNNPQSSIA